LRTLAQGGSHFSLGRVERDHLHTIGLLWKSPSRMSAARSRWLEWIYLVEQGTVPRCTGCSSATSDEIGQRLISERVFDRKKTLVLLAPRNLRMTSLEGR
jgi:hypothetical protein